MSEYAYISGGIMMTLFLLFMFTLYAQQNVEINCPKTAEQIYEQFNQSGIEGFVSGVYSMAGTFFSPCSGLPWWIYVFVFLPFVIGLAIFVTPLIGS